MKDLQANFLPEWEKRYPGIDHGSVGQAEGEARFIKEVLGLYIVLSKLGRYSLLMTEEGFQIVRFSRTVAPFRFCICVLVVFISVLLALGLITNSSGSSGKIIEGAFFLFIVETRVSFMYRGFPFVSRICSFLAGFLGRFSIKTGVPPSSKSDLNTLEGEMLKAR